MSEKNWQTQTESERAATEALSVVRVHWEDLPVGFSSTWTRTVSQEGIDGYCDGVDDRHPWYGPFESPFGPPIAPPLLASRWCASTIKPLGGGIGHVHARHRSEIMQPILVGTELVFTGTVVDKFERRGGRFSREVIEVRRSGDEALVHRETREYLIDRIEPGE